MKVCPTCQRNYPDLISTCPADQTILVDGSSSAGATPKKNGGAAAAPAPAKEKEDTRTLEEKLFAPLPKRAEGTPTPAPVKAAAPPATPTSPKPAPAPSASGKMPATGKIAAAETVFDDTPQKSSKMAALPAAEDIPWNKIGPAAGIVVLILVVGFFLFHKSAPPPAPSTDLNVSPSSADVDMEFALRENLAKNATLRNQNIDVRVDNGTVILTGEASSPAKVEQAIKAAKGMAGVKTVVNRIQVNPEVGVRSVGHGPTGASAAGLGNTDLGSEQGLATQAKAHDLTIAGDRAMSHGDYKAAASFYKQALALNPEDTAASLGYTQAMEKLQ
jgi:hyperosmotically inducible periplasmic protein